MVKKLPEDEFGPNVAYREHSLLANPRAKAVRGDIINITCCEACPLLSSSQLISMVPDGCSDLQALVLGRRAASRARVEQWISGQVLHWKRLALKMMVMSCISHMCSSSPHGLH